MLESGARSVEMELLPVELLGRRDLTVAGGGHVYFINATLSQCTLSKALVQAQNAQLHTYILVKHTHARFSLSLSLSLSLLFFFLRRQRMYARSRIPPPHILSLSLSLSLWTWVLSPVTTYCGVERQFRAP